MEYDVQLTTVEPRATAVVRATTTWRELPALWGRLSGEVWECLRANGIQRGCRNVMLYLDDAPTVEVGVLLHQPCALTGRVVRSVLPGGQVATTTHRGDFGGVGAAHDAVVARCRAKGYALTGVRWEVYGPHADDPGEQWTQVSWLLA